MVMGQNVGQIRPNVAKKVKKQALSISFFHILHGEYLLKQKAVVVKILEWKFEGNIARSATFERHLGPNFTQFGSKMAKN